MADKVVDRERTLNDITNTGVTAALIGGACVRAWAGAQHALSPLAVPTVGFALSNLQTIGPDDVGEHDALNTITYMLSFVAVHASTCSCLTSAMLYRKANSLTDDDVPVWAQANQLLLRLPWLKFVMGCSCYIVSVIFQSLATLESFPGVRYTALAIGLMSMSTVVLTAVTLRAL